MNHLKKEKNFRFRIILAIIYSGIYNFTKYGYTKKTSATLLGNHVWSRTCKADSHGLSMKTFFKTFT